MSGDALLGLVFFVLIAAAFAGFWHRVWRLGTLPSMVAALCSTAAALGVNYVEAGRFTPNDAPIVALLFAFAWAIGTTVQVVTRQARARALIRFPGPVPAIGGDNRDLTRIARRSLFNFAGAILTIGAMQFLFYGQRTGNFLPLALIAPVYVFLIVMLVRRYRRDPGHHSTK